jgi:hypothetical protein
MEFGTDSGAISYQLRFCEKKIDEAKKKKETTLK